MVRVNSNVRIFKLGHFSRYSIHFLIREALFSQESSKLSSASVAKVSKFKEQEGIILDDEENPTSEELTDSPETNENMDNNQEI